MRGKQVRSYYFLRIVLSLRADIGSQWLRCEFLKDLYPYTILQEDPVHGQDQSSKASCASEDVSEDKAGAEHASNPSPVQHISSDSGDNPQSRAVTPDSVPKAQLERTVPATGLEIDAHPCQAEPRACAGEVDRPADYVQPPSQKEQPERCDLAVQSSGAISNEELHSQNMACVTAAAPSTHANDIHMRTETATQPVPRKKRAYCRRTRTGCITCRQRKKKCDEQRPSCTWISLARLWYFLSRMLR